MLILWVKINGTYMEYKDDKLQGCLETIAEFTANTEWKITDAVEENTIREGVCSE